METITENHNWMQYSDQQIVGILAPMDTSINHPHTKGLGNIAEEAVERL